jgi:DNA polymerase I-like protein with 3'-5' exonuclease and polymerase domains
MALPEFLTNPNPEVYLREDGLCLDFETTNLKKGSPLDPGNRVVLACWTFKGEAKSTREKYSVLDLFSDLDECSFLIAHNAKFEIAWLRRLGYTGDVLIYDTMLAEYVLAGNRKWPLALDDVAKKYGGEGKVDDVASLIDSGVCPSTIDIDVLEKYCYRDIDETQRVYRAQLVQLRVAKLLPTLYTRCLLTPVLASLEATGVALDRQKVLEEYTEYAGRLSESTRALDEFTGGINLNSPKQLAEYLYDTLKFAELKDSRGKPKRNPPSKLYPDGSRLTSADVVVSLTTRSVDQAKFVELYKGHGSLKVNTKALEKLWECCTSYPLDQVPILYASYNQAVTATHRLSSSGSEFKLQFHNFNRRFKPLFGVRNPGWSVGESDGIQLEFRVAGHLGRDEAAGKDIRDPNFDAHFQTAEAMLKRVRKDISSDERTDAKPTTFRPLYGATQGSKEELAYFKFFQDRYKSIYRTQTGWTHRVNKDKQLVTETGLIFYWPNCRMTQSGYITDRTSIFNYPVQSLATADIIPINLVFVYYRMRDAQLRSFLTNTVHDSVIGEIHPDEHDQFADICKISFTEDTFIYLKQVYNITFTVPLGAEIKIGSHWGYGKKQGGKEWTYNLDPDKLDWLENISYFGELPRLKGV